MSAVDILSAETSDTAKRQQILEGARRCFLAQGFDATSINDIVKAAGVSKGTVYAYFASKEKLFEALIYQDRRSQAEQYTTILDNGRPVGEVLYDFGISMVKLMSSEESIAQVRTVVAVADKFPEIGRSFYQAGPAFAYAKIATYLASRMAAGELRQVDPELAAMQFIDVISGCVHKPRLFNVQHLVKKRTVEEVVAAGVDLFLNGLAPR
ncbi:MAG: TetR/AcrR family transcriptional regulator [Pseudomonadota bacterium]|nr:TetR/AcrR family transcriptional regulator [Pseudomonadota bacterium]